MDDDDAIAVVGIGGKFPGADNINEFWKILVNGENHVTEIPPDRWNVDAYYDQDQDAPGKTFVRKAGLLKRYDEFDNKMFGISEIEAHRLDPQQRYVLECVHMALEDGGIPSSAVNGTATGVFIGVMNDDYKVMSSDDLDVMTNYSLTGASQSLISARVSYVYNLLGPSMVIDTACSSSLVAVDTGIQNIKTGRCSMAICGGVNSLITPDLFIPLSRARMISPTGQCQAFSANADGYCRGEGCGVVILKRLGEAKRDKNKIWATIATCCNQDGHTATPITAPSSTQQEHLLKQIFSENKIDPASIQVIEAHGTGTPVGDPIEINTLGRFFINAGGKTTDDPIYVASVKTNIGHLESAAGAASLIKVLLMMKNKTIVPSLHFSTPNPKIDFQKYRFEVPTTLKRWKKTRDGCMMACTNCFGFGGTNAHAIIKHYDDQRDDDTIECTAKHLVFLSSNHESELANTLQTFLDDIASSRYNLCDVSYTSLCRRDHLISRVAMFIENLEDLTLKVRDRKQHVMSHHLEEFKSPRVIAVFCGVGTVWKGMCRDLVYENSIFTDTVHRIDKILQQFCQISLYDTFVKGHDITDPFTGHLAIFTCQIALWVLWRHYGLRIDAVVGQSVGEVAASFAAGCLTLEEAVKVIYFRSSLLADVTGGKMLAIGNCRTKYVEAVCCNYSRKANLAVYSSTTSSVIACDADIVDEISQSLRNNVPPDERNTIFIKDLKVQCAYHSPHTEDAGAKLEDALQNLQVHLPNIEVLSSVTGVKADGTTFSPAYWKKNVTNPVMFKSAIVEAGHTDKFNIFLEIGPKPALRMHLLDSYSPNEAVCLSSMEVHDNSAMLKSAGKMFEYKVNLDWKTVACQGKLCDIPRVPLHPTFKGIFKPDSSLLKLQGLGPNVGSHLFVSRTHSKDAMFRITISEKKTPFVFHHFVGNEIVVPGAFFAEVCLEVGKAMTGGLIQEIGVKIDFLHLMHLVPKKTFYADVLLGKSSKNVVSGFIRRGNEAIAFFESEVLRDSCQKETINIEILKKECNEKQTAESTYENLQLSGFSYGADIKVLGNAIKNELQCLVEMHVPDEIWDDVKHTNFHPALLDGLLQTPGVLPLHVNEKETLLPAGFECLILRKGIERKMLAYAEIAYRSRQYTLYNLALLSCSGTIIAEVKGYKIKNVIESMKDQSLDYIIKWEVTDYQSISVREKSNIMLCTFNKDMIVSLSEKLSESFTVSSVLITDETISELKPLMQNLLSDRKVNQILFIPGFQIKDSMSGKDVFGNAMASCSFMLATVQAIETEGYYIPVTVITECTQVCDVSTCDRINLCGSELWGQVRSFLREDSMLDIIIVDCRSSLKESSILLDKMLKDRPKGVGEFVFENGEMFSNYLTRRTTDHIPKNYKDGTLDSACKIKLKAIHQDSLEDSYLEIYSSFPKINDVLQSYELLDVCIHSPTTVQTLSQDTFSLYGDVEFGLDVITYEATAKKISGINTISTNHIPDCVILYPMTVKSIVSVPSECVYPLDELPGYKTGILLRAALMYALALSCKVGTEQTALVVYDEDNKPSAKLLAFFLENVQNCQVTLESDLRSTFHAIIIKPINKQDLSRITGYDCLKSIFTLSIFITPNQQRILQMKGINVKCVQTESVLNQSFLQSFNPIVRKHLRFQLGNLAKFFDKNDYCQQSNERHDFGSTVSLRSMDLKQFGVVKLPREMLLRKNCSYVVIGGLTGLGWQIMRLLATSGAGEVISISRRYPDANKEAEMKKLETECDCTVRSLSADIADWDSTVKAFETIDKTTTLPVKGLFHGAGVLKNTLSLQMTHEDLVEVLKPKILGSWNLHLISKKYSLDYFVLHSSVTSVLGNIGQSNYGAGNSFLDSLAQYRRVNNLNGQSINWGPLSLGMMTSGPNATMLEELLKEKGYIFLEVNAICRSLLNAMINDEAQVVVGSFDWKLVGKSLSKVTNSEIRYKLRKLISKSDGLLFDANQHSLDETSCLVELSSDITKEKILEIVLKIASEAFIHDIEHIKTSIPIGEFGIDSMQVMTFANKIHEVFGIRIALVKFLSEETTFDSIVEILFNELKEDKRSLSLDDLSVSRTTLSPILRPSYNDFIMHPDEPVVTFFVDLEMTQTVADPKLWQQLFSWLQTKYPTLRTLIEANEDRSEVTKIVLDPDKTNVDFRMVKMKDLEMEKRYPSDKKTLLFDPTKDLPLRVLFANDSDKCILRLVFNHLYFDFSSVGTLVNDLRYFYLSKRPPAKADIVSSDMYQVYHKRLAETRSQLTNFWKKKIPRQIKPMSLNESMETDLDPKQIETESITISQIVVERIRNAMKLHKIKLSDLVASLYHVLLWQQIRTEDIVFFMIVDLRVHFPDLKSHVGCFGNPVPVFARIRPEMTLLNIIKTNGQMILNAIENGLLPYRDIAGIIEDITSYNVFQHRLTMEYHREFDESLQRFKNIRVKRFVSTRHTLQTNLFAWYNLEKNFLKFDLVYNSAVIDRDLAVAMLENIRRVILAMIENPKVTIEEVLKSRSAMIASKSCDRQKEVDAQKQNKMDMHQGKLSMEDGVAYGIAQ